MSILRPLTLIALVLTLAVASVTMAVARHQARAVGEVVLCTGYGMVSVSLDAEGRPTGPMMPCPDCTPPLAALDGEKAGIEGPVRRLVALAHALRVLPGPLPAPRYLLAARGPPSRV